MSLTQDMQLIKDTYVADRERLDFNCEALDIYEGNLLKHLLEALQKQLSPQSYEACAQRVAPINVMNKILEKMSRIYQPAPARQIQGTPADEELFAWYLQRIDINRVMFYAAKILNMTKSVTLQPFAHKGKPQIRIVAADHTFPLSTDTVDPLAPTHIVTFENNPDGTVEYTAYTDQEFLIFDDKMDIDRAAMDAVENPDGVNPYGVLPFVYRSLSESLLRPKPDTDLLRMTKLVPLLFSDLNYAVMFQAFSIMYGINVDDENLKMAPNAFWRFKTDDSKEGKPEIGVIKPTVDIIAVMELVQTELALWMNTRGIRPGSVGNVAKDKFASGISKMIDEMDTVELRQAMVDVMLPLETELWDLIMHKLHPVWVEQGLIDTPALFSPDAKVELVFNLQMPTVSRGQVVADLAAERAEGFTSQRRALKALNPLMSDKEIDELIAEIKAEGPAPDLKAVNANAKQLGTEQTNVKGEEAEAVA